MDSNEKSKTGFTLALVVISWFAWVTFQTVQLVHDRGNLQQAKVNQEKPFQEAVKAREQIDSINADTAKLAAQGNGNAQLVLTELRKRGITIDPNKKTIPPGSK
jgi:hypothetical protein